MVNRIIDQSYKIINSVTEVSNLPSDDEVDIYSKISDRSNFDSQLSQFNSSNIHLSPKKIKTSWGNQKPYINKPLHKAIMKTSQLKNKANKTRSAADLSNYKK